MNEMLNGISDDSMESISSGAGSESSNEEDKPISFPKKRSYMQMCDDYTKVKEKPLSESQIYEYATK